MQSWRSLKDKLLFPSGSPWICASHFTGTEPQRVKGEETGKWIGMCVAVLLGSTCSFFSLTISPAHPFPVLTFILTSPAPFVLPPAPIYLHWQWGAPSLANKAASDVCCWPHWVHPHSCISTDRLHILLVYPPVRIGSINTFLTGWGMVLRFF